MPHVRLNLVRVNLVSSLICSESVADVARIAQVRTAHGRLNTRFTQTTNYILERSGGMRRSPLAHPAVAEAMKAGYCGKDGPSGRRELRKEIREKGTSRS